MSTNYTTYGDISPRTANFAKAELLKRGQHLMVTERFGQVDPLQKNKSKTVKWRRYLSLARATAPLSEGVSPKGKKMSHVDVTAVLEQYGDLVEITDVIQDTHEDPVLQEAVKVCGEQAAETIEEIRINVLKAGSNVYYANGVSTRGTVNSPATRGDFRKIFRAFKRDKAREVSMIVKASHRISTQAVEPAFFAMCHTDLKADLTDISGFIRVAAYADSSKALPGEIGTLEEFRFIATPMFDPWLSAGTAGTTYLAGGVAPGSSLACDVYPIIIVAENAYGIVPLQGYNSITPSVMNPNHISKSDPMGQLGFVSWKTYQTAARLNELWMARLEVAAKANPS